MSDWFSLLDQLLAETELLAQSIATSNPALESRTRDSHEVLDNDSGHRIQWARNLHLEYILAMNLKPGTAADRLYGVKNMTEQDMSEACEIFSIKVKDVVLSEWMRLKSCDSNLTPRQPDTEIRGK
jgi:hypothetical protein